MFHLSAEICCPMLTARLTAKKQQSPKCRFPCFHCLFYRMCALPFTQLIPIIKTVFCKAQLERFCNFGYNSSDPAETFSYKLKLTYYSPSCERGSLETIEHLKYDDSGVYLLWKTLSISSLKKQYKCLFPQINTRRLLSAGLLSSIHRIETAPLKPTCWSMFKFNCLEFLFQNTREFQINDVFLMQ